MTSRPAALLAMCPALPGHLFDEAAQRRLHALADVDPDLVVDDFRTPRARAALARAEVLISGWDCPPLDAGVLAAAPRLRAVVHAAGSVKHHMTHAAWDRGLSVTSAAEANAVPVAEYTLAMIILANKRVLPMQDRYRDTQTEHSWQDWAALHPGMGNYRKTVGVVGYSRIGRRVVELLRPLDLTVLVHDPYLPEAEAAAAGVTRAGLDELLAAADVVTLHAPSVPRTRHLLNRRRLALMADGATLVNTARGSLVDQEALLDEVRAGRLNAVIDVTEPEVPSAGSDLYGLRNVVLTPHIAGSHGGELRRIGDYALDELERYVQGLPFLSPVAAGELARIA
ncbi:hydroxyacid dehydrogenase [Streptomyces sp. NPDC050256]|uniref:hydroxyacid dehydrogenase n=1 Tax=Streptomyces sp. NPDC050256 TaxID=3365607 RepID=UPI003798FAC4